MKSDSMADLRLPDVAVDAPKVTAVRKVLNSMTEAEWRDVLGAQSSLRRRLRDVGRATSPKDVRAWLPTKQASANLRQLLVEFAAQSMAVPESHDGEALARVDLGEIELENDDLDECVRWVGSTQGSGTAVLLVVGMTCIWGTSSPVFARQSELIDAGRAAAKLDPQPLPRIFRRQPNGTEDAPKPAGVVDGDSEPVESEDDEGLGGQLARLGRELADAQAAAGRIVDEVAEARLVDEASVETIRQWNDRLTEVAGLFAAEGIAVDPLDLRGLSAALGAWKESLERAEEDERKRQAEVALEATVREKKDLLAQAIANEDFAVASVIASELHVLKPAGSEGDDSAASSTEISDEQQLPVAAPTGPTAAPTRPPVMSEPVMSEPVMSEPVMSEPVASEPVISEPVVSEPVISEPNESRAGIPEQPTVAPAESPEPSTLEIHLAGSQATSSAAPDPAGVAQDHAGAADATSESVAAVNEFLHEGHPAAAYWVATASGATEDARVLALTSLAFSLSAENADPASVYALVPAKPSGRAGLALNAYAAYELVAHLRIALAAGWNVEGNRVDELVDAIDVSPAQDAVITAARNLIRFGGVLVPGATGADRSRKTSDLAQRVQDLKAALESRTTAYQHATKTLHYLCRDDQIVGRALALVADLAHGRNNVTKLQQLAETFDDPKKLDKEIDQATEATRSKQGRPTQIQYKAREQLTSSLWEVRDLVLEAVGIASSVPAPQGAVDDGRDQLLESARRLQEDSAKGRGSGAEETDQALSMFCEWVLGIDGAAGTSQPGDVLSRALLPAWQVPRNAAGEPELGEVSLAGLVAALRDPLSPAELAEKYAAIGNLLLANECAGSEPDDDVELTVPRELISQFNDIITEAQQLSDIASSDPFADAPPSLLGLRDRLVALATKDETRWDLALGEARQVRDGLLAVVDGQSEEVQRELDLIKDVPPKDYQRVVKVVEDRDLGTARVLVNRIRVGGDLPDERLEINSPLGDLREVLDEDLDPEASASDVAAIWERLARDRGASTDPTDDHVRVAPGLQAWTSLENGKFMLPQPATRVNDILRLLGLDFPPNLPPVDITPQAAQRSGSRVFQAEAVPADGSIVPGLGSRAGSYRVTVFLNKLANIDTMLGRIPDDQAQGANILLCPWLVSSKDRRLFLAASRRRGITALLVDNAVVGLMAAEYAGSFRALQQMTLPFTTFAHYVPFAAGNIPREVFVGREAELRDIRDENGPLFVYGGRQLGKSALLRRAAQTFENDDRIAIYIDLKSNGVGTFEPVDHLWSLIAKPLKDKGVLKASVSKRDTILEGIGFWLEQSQARRILLLLDEADLFLDADSREQPGVKQVERFRAVMALKKLMEDTDRRFKPVFAGLHQVQRFREIANTPLAHGGPDIMVGPLRYPEGVDLLRPLAALGYQLESPYLTLRLLNFANYQANLVQIVCHALVERLQKRGPANGEPPIVITAADVEELLNDDRIQGRIKERFDLTVNLEDRYKVIALTCGFLFHADSSGAGIEINELLAYCRETWPEGFEGMKLDEFGRYLEELEGLGVLLGEESGRRYRFRSPQVVALLGTADEIQRQLDERRGQFRLPGAVNPRDVRRQLPGLDASSRSPLTEEQLRLLMRTPTSSKVETMIVVASPALGAEQVVAALSMAAEDDHELRELDSAKAGSSQAWGRTTGTNMTRLVLLRDDGQTAKDLWRQVVGTKAGSRRIIVVVWPQAMNLLDWNDMADKEVLVLHTWTEGELLSWEHPFDQDDRQELIEVTGGWPDLVRRALAAESTGSPRRKVLEELGEFGNDPAEARQFLQDAGASLPPINGLLAAWLEQFMDDTATGADVAKLPIEDAEKVTDRAEMLGLIQRERGEKPEKDRFRLDPVIFRCLLES